MSDLGRMQDLPQSYRDEMAARNLVPLWPSLRAVLPPRIPTRRTALTHWAYRDIRPLLMKAGELAPMEKAERRVLVLANPGHGLEKMQASPAIYLGMQLLLPGEWAPSHRHTPNAVRLIVEGEGAFTTVEGEKCPMARGDLILTPSGLWHEHVHEGDSPVVWLDVLDLPIVHYTETSYAIEGARQRIEPGHGEQAYRSGGLVPSPGWQRPTKPYPLIRYPWADTRAALLALAADRPGSDPVQVTCVNPETGQDAQNILGLHALMLRPGQLLSLPARSPALVLHQIEGRFEARIGAQRLGFEHADTAVVPGYTPVSLHNLSSSDPAFIFLADETPLHRKLGVYEVRDESATEAR